MGGSLAYKFGLNLRSNINGDVHWNPFICHYLVVDSLVPGRIPTILLC
jgi:hypothetical protein